MGFIGHGPRGPRVGGDALLGALAELSTHPDPYTFSYPGGPGVDVLAHFCDEPLPQVLYTTFGLSRVHSSVPVAGVQTELSLRTAPPPALPARWPADALASLSHHVRRTGRDLLPGHYLHLPEPHIGAIAGFSFVADPLVGRVDTATGPVAYTYAVGLTGDDLDDALSWDPVRFTGILGEVYPLGFTDPQRPSLRTHPEAARRVRKGAREEGSSISAVEVRFLDVEPGRIDVDPAGAAALLRAARSRLALGLPFSLVTAKGPGTWVSFTADADGSDPHRVRASARLADEILATFDTTPGAYPLRTAAVTIHVIDPER